jgi:spermidine/putrescine transport system ATP-binding protein
MSDRIAVMNQGRVEQLGTPREVYEHPTTRFVANFIGTSNVITVTATSVAADEVVVDLGDGQRLVVPLRGQRPEGELTVTVRPEKISLDQHPPEADCRLRGRVEEVVYQGTFTGYTVTTTTGHRVIVHRPNSHDSSDVAGVGDTVWLSWPRVHSYLIDDGPDQSAQHPIPAGSPANNPSEVIS